MCYIHGDFSTIIHPNDYVCTLLCLNDATLSKLDDTTKHITVNLTLVAINCDALSLRDRLLIVINIYRPNYLKMVRKTKSKQISVEKWANIVILNKIGKSYNEIAKILKVSKGAISKTLKRNRETGVNTNRKGGGRPRKTSLRNDNKIQSMISGDRFATAPKIRAKINEELPVPISVSTVQRRLREKGFMGRIAAKKPLLRAENKTKRLLFARQHKDWSIDQWKSVLWSDESKFEIFGSRRRIYVRRKVNERYNPKCILPTVKHGGGSVMVWGCFSYDGVGELMKIEGIMRKEEYHRILQRSAIPSGIGLIGYGFTFQQDSDPKHTS